MCPCVRVCVIIATAVLGWSQVIRFEPAIYELLLHESVKYLLHQAKDLKELLAAREQALQTVSGSQQQKGGNTTGNNGAAAPTPTSGKAPSSQSAVSSSFSAAASTASMFASRFMQSEQTAEEAEGHKKRAQFLCELITGALLSEEIERFRYRVVFVVSAGLAYTTSDRLTD